MQNEVSGPSPRTGRPVDGQGTRWRHTGHPWVYRNDLEDLPEIKRAIWWP